MTSRWPIIVVGCFLLVLGVTVVGSIICLSWLIAFKNQSPVVISVTASYPGADAQTVAAVVGGPIEVQVNGVENLVSMSSHVTDDGTYNLDIVFKKGADPDVTLVLVQNRVSLAIPTLPAIVQMDGVTVRKQSN